MELTKDQKLDWVRINQLFAAWMYKYTQIPEEESISEEASIYTISIAAMNGNKQALGLFRFFDKLFQELTIYLSEKEKRLIANNIFHRYEPHIPWISFWQSLSLDAIYNSGCIDFFKTNKINAVKISMQFNLGDLTRRGNPCFLSLAAVILP